MQTNPNLSPTRPAHPPSKIKLKEEFKPWKTMTLPTISIRIPDSQDKNFLFLRGEGGKRQITFSGGRYQGRSQTSDPFANHSSSRCYCPVLLNYGILARVHGNLMIPLQYFLIVFESSSQGRQRRV